MAVSCSVRVNCGSHLTTTSTPVSRRALHASFGAAHTMHTRTRNRLTGLKSQPDYECSRPLSHCALSNRCDTLRELGVYRYSTTPQCVPPKLRTLWISPRWHAIGLNMSLCTESQSPLSECLSSSAEDSEHLFPTTNSVLIVRHQGRFPWSRR